MLADPNQVILTIGLSPGLLRVLGLHVNLGRIQWKERLTRDDYWAILACCDRYGGRCSEW
jgi:hypothetical protein